MKRTKTFVMKFLSVIVLGAVVLSSCTKDLEDRMDKVEESLTTVIKDIASLKSELEAMKTEPQATVSADMDAVTGKVTLKFTNPDKTIVFDGKNDGNDKAVVTVEQNKPTENYTTVTVDGKSFVFPTSIPASITSIHFGSEVAASVENLSTFDVIVTLDTNDGKQVTLAASNFAITNAYETKASIYTDTENLKVTAVTPIEGAVNEFTVTISTLKEAVSADYRLAIAQTTNVQRSQPFTLEVAAYSPITKSNITDQNTTVFFTTSVDNNTVAGTVVNSKVIKYLTAGDLVRSKDVKVIEIKGYEVVGATSIADAISKASFAQTPVYSVDAATAKTYTDAITALATDTDVKSYANIAITPNAEKNYVIDFTLPEYVSTVGTRYYLAVISGKTIEDKLFYHHVVIAVENDTKFMYKDAEIAIETVAERTQTITNALNKTYFAATGLNAIANAVEAKLVDDKGVAVAGVTVTISDAKLTGDGYLTYTYAIGNPEKIEAGAYQVVVSNVYDDTLDKKITIIHPVTITRPEVTIENVAKLGDGYSATGKFEAIKGKTSFTESFTLASVVKGSLAAEGTAYKVFYRLYTESTATPPVKAYLDNIAADDLASTYDFSATPATAFVADITEVQGSSLAGSSSVRIAHDKEYKVEAYVVYASGFAVTVATDFVFKYELPDAINGFSTFTSAGAVTTKMFDLGALTFADVEDINVSYVEEETKPFYFANGTGNFYLHEDDKKLSDNAYLTIADIDYTVKDVNFDATTMEGGADSGKYTFIQLGTTSNAKTLDYNSISAFATGIAKAVYQTTSGTAVTGIKAGKSVVQPIEALVEDVWGRTSTLTMNVTINPTPAIP